MVQRSGGSATMTVLEQQPVQEETKLVPLSLRPRHNVQWTEDTIDNEHMNKRKSKSKSNKYSICLLFTRVDHTINLLQFAAFMRSQGRILMIQVQAPHALPMMTKLVTTTIASHATNAKQCAKTKTSKTSQHLHSRTIIRDSEKFRILFMIKSYQQFD